MQIFAPVIRHKNETEKRLELITGGVLEMWSLDDPDAGRGKKYKRVIIDEAAIVPRLETAWQQSIRPTLTDLRGDAYFFSTPKGHNFFKTIFDYGKAGRAGEWKSWQMPTAANPFIDPAEIEAARQELPERVFQQEYLAEFLEGSGTVFRQIRENLTAPANTEPKQHHGHRVLMGVDWGKHNDFTALCVLCADCRQELELMRFNQIDYSYQRQRLTGLAEKWGVARIEAEANSIGEPNIEELRRAGLPVYGFSTTATSKPPLIESLALAFEKLEAKWLPDEIAAAELEAYEMTVNSMTGRTSYSAPAGLHDDTVIARALAWRGTVKPRIALGSDWQ